MVLSASLHRKLAHLIALQDKEQPAYGAICGSSLSAAI